MSQIAYADQPNAFEGMKADSGKDDVLSFLAEGAQLIGKLMVRGTDPDRQAKAPASSAEVTDPNSSLGVLVHSHDRESDAGVSGATVKDKEEMGIMHKGRVYVKVEEAITPASPVFVRFASGGGGSELGSFRQDADTATAVELPGVKYMSSAAAGEFAVLELDL
jgi:hypothetical protein